ncbi:MAG: T9SS type A sorting domain-containing protein [bacterium]
MRSRLFLIISFLLGIVSSGFCWELEPGSSIDLELAINNKSLTSSLRNVRVEVVNKPEWLVFASSLSLLGDIETQETKIAIFSFEVSNEPGSSGKIELVVKDDKGNGWRKEIEVTVISTLKTLPSKVIEETKVFQNYPNPFNIETGIPYELAVGAKVQIKIYNLSGQLIRTLDLDYKEAGSYKTKDKVVYWDGYNEGGEKVASGFYLYQLRAGDKVFTKKMIVLK